MTIKTTSAPVTETSTPVETVTETAETLTTAETLPVETVTEVPASQPEAVTEPVATENVELEIDEETEDEEILVDKDTQLTKENFYQVRNQAIKNKAKLVASQTENETLRTENETLKNTIKESEQKIVVDKILSEFNIPEHLIEFLPTSGTEEEIRVKAEKLATGLSTPKTFNPSKTKGGSNSDRTKSVMSPSEAYLASKKK